MIKNIKSASLNLKQSFKKSDFSTFVSVNIVKNLFHNVFLLFLAYYFVISSYIIFNIFDRNIFLHKGDILLNWTETN